jgi:hypothetical protein
MNALTVSRRLRDHRFTTVAEFAAEHGYAVGMPDETGRPQVLASVHPIAECESCGLRLPDDHTCPNHQETIR